MDQDFLPIQRIDVEAGDSLPFDLFMYLPKNEKRLLYRRRGDQLPAQKLEQLENHNLNIFYIKKLDYDQFVGYVAGRLKTLIGATPSLQNRILMQKAARNILSSTFETAEEKVSESLVQNLNDISTVIVEAILQEGPENKYSQSLFKKLSHLAVSGSDFQKHPVNTASLAVLMTFGLGYSNEKILSDMAMAGMLHDIGLSELSPDVIVKAHSPKELPLAERAKVYNHPFSTVDFLNSRGIRLSHFAKTLIQEHHEQFNGRGYPKAIRGSQLSELSQVLQMADRLDRLLMDDVYKRSIGDSSLISQSLKQKVTELFDECLREKTFDPVLTQKLRPLFL